ncbi:MAG: non-ribosomal peptide synthetase, partial [Ktedonobacterales bacterium]|nr:non-ribosomal peptide synthetase [Ktedonobacterales bacterium]
AYLIYTSGSTGRPKGVAVPQRGLLPLVAAQQAAFALAPTSRIAQFASPSFDAAISELLTAWGTGATVCLTAETTLHDPHAFVRWLAAQQITTVTLPPSYLATLPVTDLPALHTLVVAGEACPPALLAPWAAPGRRLVNAYGPTEVTVCATLAVLPTPLPPVCPIGRPLPTAQVYVLDAQQQPVPIGVRGELYVGGAGLAQGYVGRPDLTAERFVPHPFAATPGARLYRTGDAVRWRPDGQVEFLGRLDSQVKVRGYRVEVEEVEAQVLQHPEVQAAAVVAADQRLVAYVVFADAPVASADLSAFLGQRLPEYLVPSLFVAVARLPRLLNGKLDRRALQTLAATPVEANAEDYVAPRTSVEAEVTTIWEQVLGVAPISVTANFFALGGHSLLATQVVSRVYDVFQFEIPLHTIFEEPTVEGFAQAIEQGRSQNQSTSGDDDIPLAHGARYHGLNQ